MEKIFLDLPVYADIIKTVRTGPLLRQIFSQKLYVPHHLYNIILSMYLNRFFIRICIIFKTMSENSTCNPSEIWGILLVILCTV